MITGTSVHRIKVNSKWFGILKHLFEITRSKNKDSMNKYDDYIYSTFECFVKSKTRLHFSHYWLEGADENIRDGPFFFDRYIFCCF